MRSLGVVALLLAIASPALASEESAEARRWSFAVRTGVLVPSGRPSDVRLAATDALSPDGMFANRALSVPGSVEAAYRLPVLGDALEVALEAGLYGLSGGGTRELPRDPDFGSLEFSWRGRAIPLLLGVRGLLPMERLAFWPKRLRLSSQLSFAGVHSSFTTTYASEGIEAPAQSGWALGFLLGLEAGLALGPGEVLAAVRWVNARTDLGFQSAYPSQPWNARLGDVQGANVLLGYRYSL
jgi:hypothetical protein